MIPFFGILGPQTGAAANSTEAPHKKSFFGVPIDPGVIAPAAKQDALYLAGKQPEPAERRSLDNTGQAL